MAFVDASQVDGSEQATASKAGKKFGAEQAGKFGSKIQGPWVDATTDGAQAKLVAKGFTEAQAAKIIARAKLAAATGK